MIRRNPFYFDNDTCTITRATQRKVNVSLCFAGLCAESARRRRASSSPQQQQLGTVRHPPTSRRRNRIRYIDRRTPAIYGRQTRISRTDANEDEVGG